MRPRLFASPRLFRFAKLLAIAWLLIALVVPGWTQSTPPPGQSAGQAKAEPSSPQPAVSAQPGSEQSGAAQPQPSQHEQQQPITKAQAKELFRSVDEILRFDSNDTGLPIKHSVKRKLITRKSVESYVDKKIKDDKDTQRLERSQAILKKFGLLPPDYDLHTEFLRLLGEQVAAYYDSKTKTVNLLDWVQPDIQKPVLAHELTHALQDQTVDLEKWALGGAKDDRPQPDQREQEVEEAQAARQAVTEGQAMVVMLDYSLAPMGKSVATAPDVVNAMRAGMGDSADSPVFAAAPMFLKESMLMPYTFGIDFVRYVLVHQGKNAAFGGMLERPPIDTRQIMQPETYVADERVAPLTVPDLDKLVGPTYERYDFGEMGEFDVYLLTKQYAPESDPKEIYSHWRGGYYFAVHAKGAPKDQIALMYRSRWDSPEAAKAFEKMYRNYIPKRYKMPSEGETSQSANFGHGGGGAVGTSDSALITSWVETASGRIEFDRSGSDLLILEGFDDQSAKQIRKALL